jgi:hypothetical protein
MSADQLTASGVFRVGDVLSGAWRIFTGNLPFFLGIPVLIYAAIAGVFAALVSLFGMTGGNQQLVWIGLGLVAIVDLTLYTIGQAVVVIGAFQRLRGEPLRAGAALRQAFVRALPLVVLAVLWSLALGICMILAFVAVPLGVFRAGTGMLLAYALMPIALVPAAMAFVVWVAVVPACVIEGLGPIASMLRSFDLTKGCRWKIFAISLLAGVLLFAGGLLELIADPVSPLLAFVAYVAWLGSVMALWNCTIIMIYHGLRAAREGIDAGQVASVFD